MRVDVRAPRFAAWITAVVLAAILITGNGWLALAQLIVFVLGAVSLRHAPYGVLFRRVVAPRLGPPARFEAAEPPRFAQAVGAVFLLIATIGYIAGAPVVGMVATAAALVAAFLNAAFGFCLGCEVYLVLRRTFARDTASGDARA